MVRWTCHAFHAIENIVFVSFLTIVIVSLCPLAIKRNKDNPGEFLIALGLMSKDDRLEFLGIGKKLGIQRGLRVGDPIEQSDTESLRIVAAYNHAIDLGEPACEAAAAVAKQINTVERALGANL